MAYGWPVTNGTRISTGTAGYIVRFNLVNQEPVDVDYIQLLAGGEYSDPVTDQVDADVLAGYLNDADPPAIAFSLNGTDLDVFLETATYPYEAATEIGVSVYTNAINAAGMGATADCPQEAETLALLTVQELLELQAVNRVPATLSSEIRREKRRLGL